MKLYFRYFSIHLRCCMQYKASFFMTVMGQFLSSFTMLASVYFLMSRFHQIEGFTLEEVLLCFATMLLSFSLAEMFARGFDLFPQMIGNGEFDRILIRPRNALLQVLGSKMEFTRLGKLLQAIAVFAYALPASGVIWSWDKILTLILMNLCGTLLFSALFVVYASLCFFTTQGLEVMNVLTNGGLEFGRYPFSVYGKQVLRFLTFVVPLALVQYYPFLYLIGRTDNPFYCLIPVASLLFLIPCFLLWKLGLRHYRSTGS